MNLPATRPSCTHEPSRQLLIQQLRGKIRRVETTNRNDDGTIVSSGSRAIDGMLPAGGYNRGTIIEWLADHGSGAEYLSLLAARHAADDGGALVIVDQHSQFYPPAARAMGIALGNLIVLRGSMDSRYRFHHQLAADDSFDQEDFYWAIDQSLRCSSVAAVWARLPDFESPQIGSRWLRRFQLSAEASGCLGLFMRPRQQKSASSWSEIQWQIEPQRSTGDHRHIRASLVRCRGGTVGRCIDLEINTVTGNVRQARREHAERVRTQAHSLPLAAQLAHPATGRRTARA
jgi:hypothetical protein